MSKFVYLFPIVLCLCLPSAGCESKEEPEANANGNLTSGGIASTGGESAGSDTGGDASGGTDGSSSEDNFECPDDPFTDAPEGALIAQITAKHLAQQVVTGLSHGYAVTRDGADRNGKAHPRIQFFVTDKPACGYAKSAMGQVGTSYLRVSMRGWDDAPAYAAGTYAASIPEGEELSGDIADYIWYGPPYAYTKESCGGGVGTVATGRIVIDQLDEAHVRGEFQLDWITGSFDFPVCNSGSPDSFGCGCQP